MIVRNVYNVTVCYPSNLYPAYDKVIDKIANQFDIEENGSGMGFGMRDISFDFDTEIQAVDFLRTVRQIKDTECSFDVLKYDENDDIIDEE